MSKESKFFGKRYKVTDKGTFACLIKEFERSKDALEAYISKYKKDMTIDGRVRKKPIDVNIKGKLAVCGDKLIVKIKEYKDE